MKEAREAVEKVAKEGKEKSRPRRLEATRWAQEEKVGKERKCQSHRGDNDKERELRDGDLQAGECFWFWFYLSNCLLCRPLHNMCAAGPHLLPERQIHSMSVLQVPQNEVLKAPGRAPLLIVHRTPAAPLMDLYVLPEESLKTETDISEPSSKILRVSEWAAGVAQAIQDHADILQEVSRQRAEEAKSAARATVMAAVIQMGGSVVDFREWVRALEGGEEDGEEEGEGEESPEDPKGKRRALGENPTLPLRLTMTYTSFSFLDRTIRITLCI